jgi:hypothetical protein
MMVGRDAVRDADLTRNQRTGREDNWHSLTSRVVAIRISKSTMNASAGVLAQLVERLNGIEHVYLATRLRSAEFSAEFECYFATVSSNAIATTIVRRLCGYQTNCGASVSDG